MNRQTEILTKKVPVRLNKIVMKISRVVSFISVGCRY